MLDYELCQNGFADDPVVLLDEVGTNSTLILLDN